MFTITAIVLILTALLSFFAPPSLVGTDATANFSAKIMGVLYFSFGVLAWLVRNAEPSKTRDSVVVSYILLFVLWAAVSVYGIFLVDMPTHSFSWVPALIQALLAIGFITANNSSKSKNTV